MWIKTIILCSLVATCLSVDEHRPKKKDEVRGKRNLDYTITHTYPYSNLRAERRISNFGQQKFPAFFPGPRPYGYYRKGTGSLPPYAVQMEPLVHYSQRDPLYDPGTLHLLAPPHNDLNKPEDLLSENNHLNENVYGGHKIIERPVYIKEPEPIIEIIIKEANTTTVRPEPLVLPQQKKKKEEVQVFYVKYKKNPHGTGKDSVIYDQPVPALSPVQDEHVEEEHDVGGYEHVAVTSAPPVATTIRAIIKPDSETFHADTGIHVTFGGSQHNPHAEKYSHDDEIVESAPHPAISHPEARRFPEQQPLGFQEYRAEQRVPQPYRPFNFNQPPQTQTTSIRYNQPPPPFQRPVAQGPPPTKAAPPQFNQPRPYQPFEQFQFPKPHSHFPVQQQLPLSQPPVTFAQQRQQQFTQQQYRPQFPSVKQQLPQPAQVQFRPQNQQNVNHFPQQNQNNHQQKQEDFQFNQNPNTFSSTFNQNQVRTEQNSFSYNQNHLRNEQSNFNQNNHLRNEKNHVRTEPSNFNQKNNFNLQQNQFKNNFNQQNQQTSFNQPKPVQSFNFNQPKPELSQNQQGSFGSFNQLKQEESFSQPKPVQSFNFNQPKQELNQNQQSSFNNFNQLKQEESFNQPKPVQSFNFNQPKPELSQNQQGSFTNFNQLKQEQSFNQNHQHIIQQQQQQQQNILPPGGELIQALPKFEQHISIPPQSSNDHLTPNQFSQEIQQQFRSIDSGSQKNDAVAFQNQQISAQFPSNLVASQSNYQTTQRTPSTTRRVYYQASASPSTTPTTTTTTTTTTTPKPEITAEDLSKFNLQLPDEVPDDLRQQLLSSGILQNAQISVLDYDKVGDIPISALPPDQLANFYGAGGAQQIAASEPKPSIVKPDGSPVAAQAEALVRDRDDDDQEPAGSEPDEVKVKDEVQMKVVHFDPKTEEGQQVRDLYVKEGATQVDPVVLNDQTYNRYLPLKVSGAQFPIPDLPELKDKKINSVVVLAPVDYSFKRVTRDANGKVDDEIKYVRNEAIKDLLTNPTGENFKRFLDKENNTSVAMQSVILLVTGSEKASEREIFMYDVATQTVSKLDGELSAAFVDAAESNATEPPPAETPAAASNIVETKVPLPDGTDLDASVDNVELEAAASDLYESKVPIIDPMSQTDLEADGSEQLESFVDVSGMSVNPHEDLTPSASDDNHVFISSGYSKTEYQMPSAR